MRGRRALVVAFCFLALCAWCGWVSGFHRDTTSAWVTWLVSLAMVATVDLLFWQGRRGRHPGIRLAPVARRWPRPDGGGGTSLAGALPWLALFLVVVTWEVLGIDTTGATVPHLTISALTQAFRPMNAGVLLVWMLVGVGYGAVRARTPDRPRRPERSGQEGSVDRPSVVMAHLPPATPGLLLPANRSAGVVFWLGILLVGLVVDLAARRSSGRLATAEELLGFITRGTTANVLVAVAWLYGGFHLFAR